MKLLGSDTKCVTWLLQFVPNLTSLKHAYESPIKLKLLHSDTECVTWLLQFVPDRKPLSLNFHLSLIFFQSRKNLSLWYVGWWNSHLKHFISIFSMEYWSLLLSLNTIAHTKESSCTYLLQLNSFKVAYKISCKNPIDIASCCWQMNVME